MEKVDQDVATHSGGGMVESVRGVPLGKVGSAAFRPEETARADIHPLYPGTGLLTQIVPQCSLRCIFCSGPPPGDLLPSPTTLSDFKATVDGLLPRCSSLLLTGGEPTELEWLVEGLSHARDAGFGTIQMQSHCGRARESVYASALIDAGLTAVDIPVYGSESAVHDRITGTPGSLGRTLSGMDRMRARGAKVVIHTTLFRETLFDLHAWFKRVTALQPDGVYIQRTADVGPAGTYGKVAPGLAEAGLILEEALSVLEPEFDLLIVDTPVCLAPSVRPYLMASRKPESEPEYILMPYSDWLGVFTGGESRAKVAACERCVEAPSCEGAQREALAHLDADALRPPPS